MELSVLKQHMDRADDDRQARMLINCWCTRGFQDEVEAGSIFTERINPTFNLTLLLLQALDEAYRASRCRRLTELLHTIWHTTPVNRLFSTAEPSMVGQWYLHTDEVNQDGPAFTTMVLPSFYTRYLIKKSVLTNARVTVLHSNVCI